MKRDRASWRKATLRGFAFEDFSEEFLLALGYEITHRTAPGESGPDLLIERDGQLHPVEITAPRQIHVMTKLDVVAQRIRSLSNAMPDFGRPIVMILAEMTDAARTWAAEEYDLDVWDLPVLRAQAAAFPELAAKLEKIVPEESEASSGPRPDDRSEKLQQQLTDHLAQKEVLTPYEYEGLCLSVFAHLFDPILYGFERQAQTSDGGNRYDFICRIQPGSSFWDGIRSDFRTKAILFECKNYTQPITADQVYSTERYLFAGALRTVCFLISRLPPSDSALRAAQGAMRESGKLVLLLSNRDMIEMLALKSQPGAAENYLDKKIWDFIISLPR
jgi:hypothetical protein